MEKVLSFKQKIDIILKHKQLSLKEMEKALAVDGTIYKAYNENREPRKKLVAEIQRKFQVKSSWWNKAISLEEGDIFIENGTPVPEADIKKNLPYDEEREILIRNIDRMGELNDFLLKEVKRLRGD